jgi:hypothetical protein
VLVEVFWVRPTALTTVARLIASSVSIHRAYLVGDHATDFIHSLNATGR